MKNGRESTHFFLEKPCEGCQSVTQESKQSKQKAERTLNTSPTPYKASFPVFGIRPWRPSPEIDLCYVICKDIICKPEKYTEVVF